MQLTLGCMDFLDRTRPVLDGTLQVPGMELKCTVLRPPELFPRLGEFDVQELSSAGYVTLRASGDDRYVGLPIFTWKSWLIGNIVVNADSGIRTAGDLKGKRIATPGLYLAGTMWIRGWLRDAYGLTGAESRWVTNAAPAGSVRDRLAKLVTQTPFEELPADRDLSAMLERGEVDAWLAPGLPQCFLNGSPKVRRLFPNYRELEEAEARRTRDLPLLHNLLLRRELHERNPGLAQALIATFSQARELGKTRLANDGAFAVGLPWVRHDVEQLAQLFGGRDWYACGYAENREMLATLSRYAAEQGFTPSRIDPAQYFVA
jgi:4,5-dihydroxyphthalate decarboxylase